MNCWARGNRASLSGHRGLGPGSMAVEVISPELADDPEVSMRFIQDRSILTALSDPDLRLTISGPKG